MKTHWITTIRRTFAIAMTCFAVFSATAEAQDYPQRATRIIVPYSAGTPPDIIGRIVAERLQANLGQPYVIENRPGASGTVALSELMRQPADGYTLMVFPMAMIASPVLYPEKKIDYQKDLTPIGQVGWPYNVLVVNDQINAKTAKELVDLLK
ncbi:MAG: Bug family tripartite tricarboxylate transporter substrate binding protein, partial [Betaproteobacteria bacterium]